MARARKKLVIICIRTTETDKFLCKGRNGLLDIMRPGKGEIWPNSKNNIHSGRIIIPSESERFPNNSFYSISFNRSAYLSMDTNTQSALIGLIRPADQGKAISMYTFSLAVNLLKLPPLSKQVRFVKALTGQFLCRKPFSPFGSSGTDDSSTTTGAHSLTKSVGAFTFQIAWLKSPFAHCIYILFLKTHQNHGADTGWLTGLMPNRYKSHTCTPLRSSSAKKDKIHRRNHTSQNENNKHIRASLSNVFVCSTVLFIAKPLPLCYCLRFRSLQMKFLKDPAQQ